MTTPAPDREVVAAGQVAGLTAIPESEKESVWAEYLAGYFSTQLGQPERQPTREEIAEAKASFEQWWANQRKLCDRCHRRGYMGRLLAMNAAGEMVCIDCFSYLSGISSDDPLADPALTVSSYGSVFAYTREKGWTVNGEPYNPDEDGVHQRTWWRRLLAALRWWA